MGGETKGQRRTLINSHPNRARSIHKEILSPKSGVNHVTYSQPGHRSCSTVSAGNPRSTKHLSRHDRENYKVKALQERARSYEHRL